LDKLLDSIYDDPDTDTDEKSDTVDEEVSKDPKIEINIPDTYKISYRKCTREWIIRCSFSSNNVCLAMTFSSKKKNKVKKQFYKFCTSGILGEEMLYRFENNKIHFIEEIE
jgi:hypothetical protein